VTVNVSLGGEEDLVEGSTISLAATTFTTAVDIANRDLPYHALRWLTSRRGKRITYWSSRFPAFRDCVITSISTTRTNRLALRITVELKQVRIAQSQTVTIPPRKKKKIVDTPNVVKGPQPAKTPDEGGGPRASGLAGLTNLLGFTP
jgi:hypothetical protein